MEQDLSQSVRQKALELGFSKVGIVRPGALEDERAHLDEWFKRGYAASMSWMSSNREKRAEVCKVFPEVKSIVCVALNYYTNTKHSQDQATGKISRYAWGDDYHVVMSQRLESLLQSIQILKPDIRVKVYADTGPMMEKAWASRAGIGWQGKHTNLITKDFGSWVFLGEILLDVELEYDEPIADACGTCTACIEACPTNAIVEPYVLDSSKCISYLTIEHRGEIPVQLAEKFERWIYGCDICQDVCPWNRFQVQTEEAAFRPRPRNVNPDLLEIENLTTDEFNERFRKSPVKRTKRVGLVRNAKAVRAQSMNRL